ncbi:hypothetical protein [Scytonema sp. UIC 10036]|uniref:hypothetical protein n=1 Tax=Scytonema sp. UIC 10036 TaxID=2304196 RepID=UPI001A9BAB63|nr:hypothetical protein [Scytonema sp. UIC 10036]
MTKVLIVRSQLDNEEWGDEPADPDDVWCVGDRVRLRNSTVEGTVCLEQQKPFLNSLYLPYVLVLWDGKNIPIPVEPELLVRLTRYIPQDLTWQAAESFADESHSKHLNENTENEQARWNSSRLTPQIESSTSTASYKSHTSFVQDNQIGQYWLQEPASTDSSGVSEELDSENACGVSQPLLGGSVNSPSKNLEQPNPCFGKNSPSNDLPTSKDRPSKNRRTRGEGNGTIHWRTLTKNGKDYLQAYYHWKENGRKKSKYIPKQLLELVQQAEEQKRPVIEILAILSGESLLVGKENSPSKVEQNYLFTSKNSPSNIKEQPIPTSKNSPSNVKEQPIPTSKNSPSNVKEQPIPTSKNSPSKTRRHKGLGTGSLQWKTITLNGKDYPQPWYHYEVWIEGDRITKKSKYIPKRLLSKIQELEAQKASVSEILEVLGEKI